MVIGIIGGGASGMCAALAASENPDAQVLLFERQARVGKKLLATGNGRCNLTNLHADIGRYHGQYPEFAKIALEQFSAEATLDWFRGLGLYTVAEASGRVYPYSDQANSVVDVLRFALDRPNIQILTGTQVRSIKRGFTVETEEKSYHCDKLIVACGGLAGTKLGGSMSGYQLLKSMGHSITKLRPALVQIKSDWRGCEALRGVRANCRAEILCGNELVRQSEGELQFTQYGLSGPVIFEISRDVCRGGEPWLCRLDFLPDMEENALLAQLSARKSTGLLAEDLLTGVLHNRLGRVLTGAVGIRGNRQVSSLSEQELLTVCQAVKNFEISLSEPMGMDSAQVTAGGADSSEFSAKTMESRLVAGLYACGEVLDIDGDCGGFNLQWAWSSGRLAGLCAGEVNNDSNS